MTWGDRRSAGEQVRSGDKIAGAIVLSLTTIGLFGRGYRQVIHPAVRHEFITGWAILLPISLCLALTMRFWRLWFPWVPVSLGIRSLRLLFLVPFGSPFVSVVRVVIFPALMFLMAYLSIPFSKRNSNMTILGRVALFVASISFLLATSHLFIAGTQDSVLMLSSAGDIALLISVLSSKRIPRH